MAKFLDDNGLLYFWQKIKAAFVAKETGKGLSENSYTTAEKDKLAGLENYTLPAATADTLGGVRVGAGLTMNGGVMSATGGGVADSVEWNNVQNKPNFALVATSGSYNDLSNKPSIPTNNNELLNGAGYQTAGQVTILIDEAVSGLTGISFEIVETLPATGESGKIYLIPGGGIGQNIYDEYIYFGGRWEKIGSTDIDLSDYLKKEDITVITNAEIDAIVAA